jgi:NitT/TauT family transport system ATP-binding protein
MTVGRAARILWDEVGKIYKTDDGHVRALDEVSLDIEPGSLVALLGPSGCGKSTILRLTAGLMPATSGRITIDGEHVKKPRTDIGFVFQQDLLLEWRTALDNVLLQAQMRGLRQRDYRDRADELLELVGLTGFKEAYPAELSGGMRQRVALVRALLMDLPALLLDEPFGALDALTRDQLNVDFQHLWYTTRPTVVFVTHSITEAVLQADRIVVLTSRPAKVRKIVQVDLPRPRRLAMRETASFNKYVGDLREIFLEFGVLSEPDYGELELNETDGPTPPTERPVTRG